MFKIFFTLSMQIYLSWELAFLALIEFRRSSKYYNYYYWLRLRKFFIIFYSIVVTKLSLKAE